MGFKQGERRTATQYTPSPLRLRREPEPTWAHTYVQAHRPGRCLSLAGRCRLARKPSPKVRPGPLRPTQRSKTYALLRREAAYGPMAQVSCIHKASAYTALLNMQPLANTTTADATGAILVTFHTKALTSIPCYAVAFLPLSTCDSVVHRRAAAASMCCFCCCCCWSWHLRHGRRAA